MNLRLKTASLYEYMQTVQYSSAFRHQFICRILSSFLPKYGKKYMLFILGFQRSGTTITFHTLEKLNGVRGFNEYSSLSEHGDEKLRLNDVNVNRKILKRTANPYYINKPLVESQNADILLDKYKNSKAIWMYRHYKDVINSFQNKFGKSSGREHLLLIIQENKNNWRSEKVPQKYIQLAQSLYQEDLSDDDCTALYWYIRNSLFYEFKFDCLRNLKLVKYEYFMTHPAMITRRILEFWNYSYDINESDLNFKTSSIKKGEDIQLQPHIEKLCSELLLRLDITAKAQGFAD